MLSGLVGVPLGSLLAQRLRPRYDRIDPHICAAGLLVSGPIFFLGLLVAASSDTWCFTMVFFGEIFLNLTWSIVADILLVRNDNVWFGRGERTGELSETGLNNSIEGLAAK